MKKNASSKCQRRSSNHRRSLAWTKIAGFKCGRFASYSDRVKETLFNWLMPYIVDSYCLDCFAGSGSLGFEALSRQAKQVTFLELDKTVANQLKKNLQTLKTTTEQAQVINQNSLEFLKQAQNQPHFDVVFWIHLFILA